MALWTASMASAACTGSALKGTTNSGGCGGVKAGSAGEPPREEQLPDAEFEEVDGGAAGNGGCSGSFRGRKMYRQ